MTEILTSTPGQVALLWLATQQQIGSRTAHEIKNTLNGVAVNLEVVRSRLGRVSATPSPATAFAETASAQFELLTQQTEALLALVRPAASPADVDQLACPLAGLLGTAAEKDGGRLVYENPSDEDGGAVTATAPGTTRLLVAAALLAAVDALAEGTVHCIVHGGTSGPRLEVRRTGAGALRLPDDVARVAADAGVRVDAAGDGVGLILSFPPAPRGDDLTQRS